VDAGRDPSEIGVRVTVPARTNASGVLDLPSTLDFAEPYFEAGATAAAVAVAPFARSWSELEDVVHRLASAQARWRSPASTS
jgi:hypothetical protein